MIFPRIYIFIDFVLSQSFLYGRKDNPNLSVGLRLGEFPTENKLIIACALDNSKIEVIIQTEDDENWIKCKTLNGHEDWVRGLDFTNDGKSFHISPFEVFFS